MTTAAAKIDTQSQRVWSECCQKEDKLRLKWFLANQNEIIRLSQSKPKSESLQLQQNEIERERVQKYRSAERIVANKGQPEPKYIIDDHAIISAMRPVDPKLKELFYEANAQNRKLYLKERMKIIPEERYYMPLKSSYVYGWKMFYHAKTNPLREKHGRVQIIRDSFYRRCGVSSIDPDHYKTPARLSPNPCFN